MDSNPDHNSSIDVDAISDRFQQRWRSGHSPQIEDFLVGIDESVRARLLHRLLRLEWTLRTAGGHWPTMSEYISRFPSDDDLVRDALSDTNQRGDSSGTDSTLMHGLRPQEDSADDVGEVGSDASDRLNGDSDIQQIGRYSVIRLLGKGGFARVYLAHDGQLNRSVAIKVPSRVLSLDGENAERYLAEARLLAVLDHPNIVPVYDVGSSVDHPCFIVSKWIEGTDLSRKLKSYQPSFHEAAELVATVADALNYAHRRKIIHRDIKPGNILIDRNGKPYVADFGVALSEEDYGKPVGIVGTPSYMSPEQARGEGHLVDGRSDIFNLGVVFYRLLTGDQPFGGADRAELVERIARLEVRPPRQLNPEIPKELERICLKTLAKRASDRYATCRDLVDDLRCWLDGRTDEVAQAPWQAAAAVASDATPTSQNLGVVPKGLRCFDRQDADFFLALVPGPRDRNGLPDSLRQWTHWTEQASADDVHRVGVVYGPSGCGKSSLMRAGFLPLLPASLERIVVDASPRNTESRLLRLLHERFEQLSPELTLSQSLAALRRDRKEASSRKLLIVVDQFEQWLHGQDDYESTELLLALRQCDGVRVQCLLLVRDDFFLALSRFMSLLEIPLVQGRNMMLVDLFEPSHARKVLTLFGRAFDKLPIWPVKLTREQEQFISKSIESLESGGKIFPVRLALFTEMVKGQPWTTDTVVSLGGAEGIGAAFLEESFSSEHAPANQRVHELAARAVLEFLLPEPGMMMKDRRRTGDALMEASGYAERPHDFRELVEILDFQLRLITPTEATDFQPAAATAARPTYYQLSHDYLVPSVREWISRKQRQSFIGRLQLQFADRTSIWASMPAKRLLPTWWEWVKFRIFLRSRRWTEPQRAMMRLANRRFAVCTTLIMAVLLLAAFGLTRAQRRLQAESLRNQLVTAQLSQIPAIIEQLAPYRREIENSLQELAAATDDFHSELAANLALVEWDETAVDGLCRQALDCQPDAMVLVCDALAGRDTATAERFWTVLEDEQADRARRFRSAQVLAKIAAPIDRGNRERWMSLAPMVEAELVSATIAQPQYFSTLVELFRPTRSVLIGPLSRDIGTDEQSARATNRTNILVRYLADDPAGLVDVSLAASRWQLDLLLPVIAQQDDDIIIPLLREAVTKLPNMSQSADERDLYSRRAATAAALLAVGGHAGEIWSLFGRSPNPGARTYLIYRLRQCDVPLALLTDRFLVEQEAGIRAALLMAIGQYDVLPEMRRLLLSSIQVCYETHEDPGLHGAAEWLLRQWERDDVIDALRARSQQLAFPDRWRINSQGHTMVRVDGRQVAEIGRVFEIATLEVSVRQFLRFRDKYYNQPTAPTEDCPMNVVTWYDAIEYCHWLNEREGLTDEQCYYRNEGNEWVAHNGHLDRMGYRLPTQNEWEFACRAGTDTTRYFGDHVRLMDDYAWYEVNSGIRSWPCGRLKPNDHGLFDMYGNVIEWCDDLDKANRVICGGTYGSFAKDLTSNSRRTAPPWTEFNSIGFRIGRTVEQGDPAPDASSDDTRELADEVTVPD